MGGFRFRAATFLPFFAPYGFAISTARANNRPGRLGTLPSPRALLVYRITNFASLALVSSTIYRPGQFPAFSAFTTPSPRPPPPPPCPPRPPPSSYLPILPTLPAHPPLSHCTGYTALAHLTVSPFPLVSVFRPVGLTPFSRLPVLPFRCFTDLLILPFCRPCWVYR